MKFMKLGSRPDTFITTEAVRSVNSEVISDLIVQVKGSRYLLHKFPLLSKCLRLQRLCSESPETSQHQIVQLPDFPGGIEAFELCAKFCYGITITLSAYNIIAARCAAEYLQMTEDVEKGNLIYKLEVFFNSCILSGWKDSIVTLQSTKTFPLWSEDLGITSRCIEAIASKVLAHPSKVNLSRTYSRRGDVSCNNETESRRHNKASSKIWWAEDLAELSIDLYWRSMIAIKSGGKVPPTVIGDALRVYASRWLPNISKYANLEKQLGHDQSESDSIGKHRLLLESIISLLPAEKGAVSCSFLLKLLKAANILKASSSSKMELARRVGLQLEDASVNDLLIPHTCDTIYDVDIVITILQQFMLQVQSPPTSPLTRKGDFERSCFFQVCCYCFFSQTTITNILQELSSDLVVSFCVYIFQTMGESETVVAQTSSVTDYISGYSSINPDAAGAHASSDAGNAGDLATSCPSGTGESASTNVEAGNTYTTDEVSTQQEAATTMAYDASQDLAALADAPVVSSQVADYESSANGNNTAEAKDNAAAGIAENGIASDVHGSSNLHQAEDGLALSPEEERLWSIVRTNSLDFNAWTALIEETEKMSEGNILKIRKAYDAFLAEFPLCYGYWKKYADHEARLGSGDKVVEVYERAVQGVTYSVDMWLHYCVFAISTYGDPDTIRRLFERGLVYVGTDYLSFPLWDKYLEYEYTQQAWSNVAAIYTQILQNPNQQLDRYFEGFKELVASRPLSELRTPEEAAAAAEAGDEQIEGEVNPGSDPSKPVSASLKDAEELEKYISIREEMYKKAKEFDSKIIGFETAIRRPYFHVRPLNVAELENWHNYLDFIEGGDDFNKVVKLYERCLIACANYPEYWIRYVSCMETSGSLDLADNALARATQVFVKRQPEIHLFTARLREQRGDIPGARAAYQLVHAEISPGLVEAIIKHANMERRLGNLEDACSIYEQAIAIEKGKEHSQSLPLLFAQYSRFLYLVSGKVEKAREILDQAVENVQLSKPLLEALIHLESIQSLPKRVDLLDSLIDKFLVPSPENLNVASVDEREELSSIFLEFLDLFGDAATIKKADDRHAKLFLRHRTSSVSKKRQAEDYIVSEKTKLAKSAVAAANPSVVGAYPGAQNQWPAGYGVQGQPWPQATQAQSQQWNPGYAQQAAYGAYGSYGTGYAPPQAPATSVSSSAGYGAYPSTYPAQAFPQQNFAQPAATATLTPAPQATTVPPTAYYGSYY